jgi:DNA-binding response OmpR family regulator
MAVTIPSLPEPVSKAVSLQGRNVLLVDDDPVLLRTWSRTLTREGMTVRTVGKVAEARRILEDWPRRRFDFALIDDRLPDGFGLDLVPMLSELRPVPGFAVVSALGSTERALRAWQKSVVIVPKPVSPSGLIALLGFLDVRRGRARRRRYRPDSGVVEAVRFGAFVLDADGLLGPHGRTKLTAVGRVLLASLVAHEGGWVPTGQLARDFYQRDDSHGRMLVRRQVSLLRRALGAERWIVDSALQRGYRIAPNALGAEPEPGLSKETPPDAT